jgi:transcriptional regulator with XRE-family HTH domain
MISALISLGFMCYYFPLVSRELVHGASNVKRTCDSVKTEIAISCDLKTNGFAQRLVEAFDGASMAEIARRLKLPHSTIRNYVQNDRLPSAELLIEIANRTNVSLDWLLRGKAQDQAVPLEPALLAKLRTIAREQATTVFADADIAAGTVESKTLGLLANFLLHRSLVHFNLIESDDLLSTADRRRAERFAFTANVPQSLDDRVRELIRQEISARRPLSERLPGEVDPPQPAEMVIAPHDRTIGDEEIEEIERRLKPRRRHKTG